MFWKARFHKITIADCIDMFLRCAKDYEAQQNRSLTQPQFEIAIRELEKKYAVGIDRSVGAAISYNASLDEVFQVAHVGFDVRDPNRGWMELTTDTYQGHSLRTVIDLGRISVKKAARIQIGQAVRVKGDCCICMFQFDIDWSSVRKHAFSNIQPKNKFSWSFV